MKSFGKAIFVFFSVAVVSAMASSAFASSCGEALDKANRRLSDVERILIKSRNANQLWQSRAAIQDAVGDVKEILLQSGEQSGTTQIFDGFAEASLDSDYMAKKNAEENALAECIRRGYVNCKPFGTPNVEYYMSSAGTARVRVSARAIGEAP